MAPCRRDGVGSKGSWGGAPKGAPQAEAEACREQCVQRAGGSGSRVVPSAGLGGQW